MANVLSEAKRQQVVALGQLGWPLRRIEDATGVRRETASAYLKAAGVPVRAPGGWGRRPIPKPANEVSTDSGDTGRAKPANGGSTDSAPPGAPAPVTCGIHGAGHVVRQRNGTRLSPQEAARARWQHRG